MKLSWIGCLLYMLCPEIAYGSSATSAHDCKGIQNLHIGESLIEVKQRYPDTSFDHDSTVRNGISAYLPLPIVVANASTPRTVEVWALFGGGILRALSFSIESEFTHVLEQCGVRGYISTIKGISRTQAECRKVTPRVEIVIAKSDAMKTIFVQDAHFSIRQINASTSAFWSRPSCGGTKKGID